MSKIEYRHIGKKAQRIDAKEVVTGRAVFTDDYKVNDVVYGKVLGSPFANAKIKKIDISKAEALPGVCAVLTYENMPEICKMWGLSTPGVVPVLRDNPSYVGDAVALVAAETEQIAEAAVDLIEVEYEELPATLHTQDAIKKEAPVVHKEIYGENAIAQRIQEQHHISHKEMGNNILPWVPFVGEHMMNHLKRGDVDKAFEECDYIVEGENDYGALGAPLPMEPPCVVMKWDGTKFHAWVSSQVPYLFKESFFGRTAGTGYCDVTTFNLGGGFANKGTFQTTAAYAAMLSMVCGHSVKIVMTKYQQLLVHDVRIGMYMKGKIGIKNGLVHAVQGECYLDTGAYNDCGEWQMGVGLGECQIAFGKCKNWDVQGALVQTNHVQTGAVRGFGGQEIKATLMPLAMQAAAIANIDPLEFCINNFAQTGDTWFWREGNLWECREQDYVPVMKRAGESFGWKDKWKGWNVPTKTEGDKAIGVGVSVHGNADVGEDDSQVIVRLDLMTGCAYLHCAVPETGSGQHSNQRKFVAEVMDIELEKVIYPLKQSTEFAPYDAGPIGSRCTLTTGTAITKAAEDARRKLLELAAVKLHASAEDLDTKDGMIFYKNRPEEKHPWMEFQDGFGVMVIGEGRYRHDYTKSNFNIYFAEVEVDLKTGVPSLRKVTVGTDVGQIIDPDALEMQAHGGFGAAAADTGYFDESVLDDSTGRVLTSNLIDYKWRTFNDFPPFDFIVDESLPEISRFKAHGFGEISGAPGPAAIMMAISNAIGKDFCHYPATPESILKAIGRA